MATLDDGIRTLIDQVALDAAMGRIAAGIQAAGLTAVEVVDVDAYMNTASRIARRTIADADANAKLGDAPSWTDQARNQIQRVVAAQDESLTVDAVKKHLTDGLEYITSAKDWEATTSWTAKLVKKLLDDGTLRQTEPTGTGKIEIIFTETEEG